MTVVTGKTTKIVIILCRYFHNDNYGKINDDPGIKKDNVFQIK